MTELLRSLPIEEIQDYWEWDSIARDRGWSDGLPLAPPTKERVELIIEALPAGPDEIAVVPPESGVLTREQLAVQCAMAGCRPEHALVVLAAVTAMLEPHFNLYGVQSTTNPCAPLTIVSGPIVDELGFHRSDGAFGGGSHASAAVGRAVRLVLWNVGGARPGNPDMAPLGSPSKYLFCVADNASDSPWGPFHTDFGYSPDQSCVTVFACVPPDPRILAGNAQEILGVLRESLPDPAANMFHANGQYLLTLNPRVAGELARGGYSLPDVREWLFKYARFRVGRMREVGLLHSDDTLRRYWGWREDSGMDMAALAEDDSAELPMVRNPEDIRILVTGGSGQWWGGFSAGWGEYGGYFVCRSVLA